MLSSLPSELVALPWWWAVLAGLSVAGFLVATAVQITFWWSIFRPFAYEKRQSPPILPSDVLPAVSVVICARNEAGNLQNNLPHVLEQDYPNFEVVVADDDSGDNTMEILQQLQQQYPHLQVIRHIGKQNPGKKEALNKAIAAAHHELIVLTDADCRPAHRTWLQQLTAHFVEKQNTEILLGFSGFYTDATNPLLNRWLRWEGTLTALHYFAFARAGMAFMGVGRNLMYRKQTFRRVGGFEKHRHIPSGDDDLLVNAAANAHNTIYCTAPETFTYSPAKKTWAAYFRQKRRQLGTAWAYRWKYIVLLGLLSLSHVLHYLCMFLLLIFNIGMVLATSLFLMRMILVVMVMVPVLQKFREERLIPLIPVFDFLSVVSYLVFAPILFFNNKSHSWT